MVTATSDAKSTTSRGPGSASGSRSDGSGSASWLDDFLVTARGAMALDARTLSTEGLHRAIGVCSTLKGTVARCEAGFVAELLDREGELETEKALQREQKLSKRRAARKHKTAKATADHPEVGDALADGEISEEHADALADAESEHPGAVEALLDDAREQSVDVFRHRAREWRRGQDGDDGDSEADRQFKARKVRSWVRAEDGMGVSVIELDPVNHAAYIACLAYWVRRLSADKHNLVFDYNRAYDPASADIGADTALLAATSEQKRADAHMAMVAASLDGTGGASPTAQLLVIANYDAVSGAVVAKLGDGTPITDSTLRRVACHADILPSIFDSAGRPIDLGRSQRLATPEQRALLTARDGGCRGCGASPTFCVAHHITHWAANGPTDMDNLVLLCDRCHHLVHDKGYTVFRDGSGQFSIIGPTKRQARQSTEAFRAAEAHAAEASSSSGAGAEPPGDSQPPAPPLFTIANDHDNAANPGVNPCRCRAG